MSSNADGWLWFFVGLLGVVFVVSLAWRLVCKIRCVPWPHWLAFMLENPYMKLVSPSAEVARLSGAASGMKVLDLGCGSGRISEHLCRLVGESGLIVGVDIQVPMLEKFVHRMEKVGISNYRAIRADLQELETLCEADFDRILLVTVLGEVPDQARLVSLAASKLASSGLLSITEVIPDPCYLTKKHVFELCASSGLELYSSSSGLLSYTMNFRKA